jgi:RNA polymerase sigma-70 factor (ECF subfamily)
VPADARTDPELLAAIRAGDPGALSALLARHAPTVMRFAMKLCGNPADAEDVLQETLLAAARGARDLRGDAALSTWLYTVARSHCIKKRRRSVHAPTAIEPLPAGDAPIASDAPTPEDALAGREIGTALERALASLDDASREVLVLRDVEGLSAAETAEVVGASVDAVKSRLHRARASVRAALADIVTPKTPSLPSDPACPDVIAMLSQRLEGDVDASVCAAMEAHVATCASCSRDCDSLRRAVALCRESGEAPPSPEVAARIRRVLASIPAR